MELDPVGKESERFYGNVDVPDGGYIGNADGSPLIRFDLVNGIFQVTGSLKFMTAASGLMCGEIYVEGINDGIALAAEEVYYQVTSWSAGAGVNGESNGTTPDKDNDHIVIEHAGKYFVRWHVSCYSTQKNEYEFEVFINNGDTGFPGTEAYRTTSVASAVGLQPGGAGDGVHHGDDRMHTADQWADGDAFAGDLGG